MSSSSGQGGLQLGQTFAGCGGEMATPEQFRTWQVCVSVVMPHLVFSVSTQTILIVRNHAKTVVA